MSAYNHTYAVTKCPACAFPLTAPDAGVILDAYVGGQHVSKFSRLTKKGELADVDDLVANGYHSDTRCGRCGQSLAEEEIFDD